MRLAARVAGRPSDPVVLLVHGYPDTAAVWDDVAAELAPAHCILAYDVRGMGGSSAPAGPDGYALGALAEDLRAVAEELAPGRRVHVVGHDWGSIQAWEAVTEPGADRRLASFTSLSGPCLDHVAFALRAAGRGAGAGRRWRTARQALRSTYVAAFRVPGLPDLVWRTVGSRGWPRFLRAVEGVPDDGRQPTLARDGERGLELYRRNISERLRHPRQRTTEVPVLLLELTADRFVDAVLTEDLDRWVPDLTRQRLDAGHWAPRTHPAPVAAAIAAHVAAVEGRAPQG